jgi:Zn-dependent protease with chaperone function
MRIPGERVLPPLAVHVAIHLVLFTLASWVILSAFFGFNLFFTLAGGVVSAFVAILFEWVIGPSLVSFLLKPRWIERVDDVVLWSLVQGVADGAGVKVGRVGVLDVDAPDALVYASLTGRPIVLLTRGLLAGLTYPEARVVVAYLMGCAKSGVLSIVTTLSVLIILSNRVAAGYIKSRLEEKPVGLIDIILAGWGYLIFALNYYQAVEVGRAMSAYADKFSIQQTEDPSSYFNALIKVAAGLAQRPLDTMRAHCISLKGLMFQDPTSALRESITVKEIAGKYEIDLDRLLGYGLSEFTGKGDLRLHAFERFRVQKALAQRLEDGIEIGREIESPLLLGLGLVE